jgi:hypothetical protein
MDEVAIGKGDAVSYPASANAPFVYLAGEPTKTRHYGADCRGVRDDRRPVGRDVPASITRPPDEWHVAAACAAGRELYG